MLDLAMSTIEFDEDEDFDFQGSYEELEESLRSLCEDVESDASAISNGSFSVVKVPIAPKHDVNFSGNSGQNDTCFTPDLLKPTEMKLPCVPRIDIDVIPNDRVIVSVDKSRLLKVYSKKKTLQSCIPTKRKSSKALEDCINNGIPETKKVKKTIGNVMAKGSSTRVSSLDVTEKKTLFEDCVNVPYSIPEIKKVKSNRPMGIPKGSSTTQVCSLSVMEKASKSFEDCVNNVRYSIPVAKRVKRSRPVGDSLPKGSNTQVCSLSVMEKTSKSFEDCINDVPYNILETKKVKTVGNCMAKGSNAQIHSLFGNSTEKTSKSFDNCINKVPYSISETKKVKRTTGTSIGNGILKGSITQDGSMSGIEMTSKSFEHCLNNVSCRIPETKKVKKTIGIGSGIAKDSNSQVCTLSVKEKTSKSIEDCGKTVSCRILETKKVKTTTSTCIGNAIAKGSNTCTRVSSMSVMEKTQTVRQSFTPKLKRNGIPRDGVSKGRRKLQRSTLSVDHPVSSTQSVCPTDTKMVSPKNHSAQRLSQSSVTGDFKIKHCSVKLVKLTEKQIRSLTRSASRNKKAPVVSGNARNLLKCPLLSNSSNSPRKVTGTCKYDEKDILGKVLAPIAKLACKERIARNIHAHTSCTGTSKPELPVQESSETTSSFPDLHRTLLNGHYDDRGHTTYFYESVKNASEDIGQPQYSVDDDAHAVKQNADKGMTVEDMMIAKLRKVYAKETSGPKPKVKILKNVSEGSDQPHYSVHANAYKITGKPNADTVTGEGMMMKEKNRKVNKKERLKTKPKIKSLKRICEDIDQLYCSLDGDEHKLEANAEKVCKKETLKPKPKVKRLKNDSEDISQLQYSLAADAAHKVKSNVEKRITSKDVMIAKVKSLKKVCEDIVQTHYSLDVDAHMIKTNTNKGMTVEDMMNAKPKKVCEKETSKSKPKHRSAAAELIDITDSDDDQTSQRVYSASLVSSPIIKVALAEVNCLAPPKEIMSLPLPPFAYHPRPSTPRLLCFIEANKLLAKKQCVEQKDCFPSSKPKMKTKRPNSSNEYKTRNTDYKNVDPRTVDKNCFPTSSLKIKTKRLNSSNEYNTRNPDNENVHPRTVDKNKSFESDPEEVIRNLFSCPLFESLVPNILSPSHHTLLTSNHSSKIYFEPVASNSCLAADLKTLVPNHSSPVHCDPQLLHNLNPVHRDGLLSTEIQRNSSYEAHSDFELPKSTCAHELETSLPPPTGAENSEKTFSEIILPSINVTLLHELASSFSHVSTSCSNINLPVVVSKYGEQLNVDCENANVVNDISNLANELVRFGSSTLLNTGAECNVAKDFARIPFVPHQTLNSPNQSQSFEVHAKKTNSSAKASQQSSPKSEPEWNITSPRKYALLPLTQPEVPERIPPHVSSKEHCMSSTLNTGSPLKRPTNLPNLVPSRSPIERKTAPSLTSRKILESMIPSYFTAVVSDKSPSEPKTLVSLASPGFPKTSDCFTDTCIIGIKHSLTEPKTPVSSKCSKMPEEILTPAYFTGVGQQEEPKTPVSSQCSKMPQEILTPAYFTGVGQQEEPKTPVACKCTKMPEEILTPAYFAGLGQQEEPKTPVSSKCSKMPEEILKPAYFTGVGKQEEPKMPVSSKCSKIPTISIVEYFTGVVDEWDEPSESTEQAALPFPEEVTEKLTSERFTDAFTCKSTSESNTYLPFISEGSTHYETPQTPELDSSEEFDDSFSSELSDLSESEASDPQKPSETCLHAKTLTRPNSSHLDESNLQDKIYDVSISSESKTFPPSVLEETPPTWKPDTATHSTELSDSSELSHPQKVTETTSLPASKSSRLNESYSPVDMILCSPLPSPLIFVTEPKWQQESGAVLKFPLLDESNVQVEFPVVSESSSESKVTLQSILEEAQQTLPPPTDKPESNKGQGLHDSHSSELLDSTGSECSHTQKLCETTSSKSRSIDIVVCPTVSSPQIVADDLCKPPQKDSAPLLCESNSQVKIPVGLDTSSFLQTHQPPYNSEEALQGVSPPTQKPESSETLHNSHFSELPELQKLTETTSLPVSKSSQLNESHSHIDMVLGSSLPTSPIIVTPTLFKSPTLGASPRTDLYKTVLQQNAAVLLKSPKSSPKVSDNEADSDLDYLILDTYDSDIFSEVSDSESLAPVSVKSKIIVPPQNNLDEEKEVEVIVIEDSEDPMPPTRANELEPNDARTKVGVSQQEDLWNFSITLKDEQPKKKVAQPFISDDPEENWDINNPDWDIVRQLKTDEERYRMVRTMWRSKDIPNPHKNLTLQSYRSRRVKANSPAAGRDAASKRKRSASPESNRESKRARMGSVSCTFHLDDTIESQQRTLDEKEEIINQTYFHTMESMTQKYAERECKIRNLYSLMRPHYLNNLELNLDIREMRNTENMERHDAMKSHDLALHNLHSSNLGYELLQLQKARDEIWSFNKFYHGLGSNFDPTLLDNEQMSEVIELKNMYEAYEFHYGSG